jgi:hypothetical protein
MTKAMLVFHEENETLAMSVDLGDAEFNPESPAHLAAAKAYTMINELLKSLDESEGEDDAGK